MKSSAKQGSWLWVVSIVLLFLASAAQPAIFAQPSSAAPSSSHAPSSSQTRSCSDTPSSTAAQSSGHPRPWSEGGPPSRARIAQTPRALARVQGSDSTAPLGAENASTEARKSARHLRHRRSEWTCSPEEPATELRVWLDGSLALSLDRPWDLESRKNHARAVTFVQGSRRRGFPRSFRFEHAPVRAPPDTRET